MHRTGYVTEFPLLMEEKRQQNYKGLERNKTPSSMSEEKQTPLEV